MPQESESSVADTDCHAVGGYIVNGRRGFCFAVCDKADCPVPKDENGYIVREFEEVFGEDEHPSYEDKRALAVYRNITVQRETEERCAELRAESSQI